MSDENEVSDDPQRALVPQAQPTLFRRVELTGAVVCGQIFSAASADRARIVDTLFRDCTFFECSFRTADFEATLFESCSFIRCNFSTADFRSSEFSKCVIDNCNFSSGAIKTCRFSETKINGGRFDRQSLDENLWCDCELTNVNFRRATLLHMDFERCGLQRVQFADCTTLYHFFSECEFDKCRMDVDNVALSFGLTRQNLESLTLVWQGLRQRMPKSIPALLGRLLDGFAMRRWGVAACTLAINFSLLETREAFRLAFASMREATSTGRRLRSGELKFLSRVVNRLADQSALPFLTVVDGLEFCTRAVELPGYADDENLRLLALALKEAELRALAEWDATKLKLKSLESEYVNVEFVWEVRPAVELLPMLAELHQAYGGVGPAPTLIESRNGSYVEVVTMGLGTLGALALAIGMVVRSIDGLITTRAKLEVLFAKRLPSSIRTRALQPLPSTSAELAREISTCLALISSGQLPMITNGASSAVDQLRTINVSPAAPAPSPSQRGTGEALRGIEDRSGAS